MRSVHIRISHDNDFMITNFFNIKLFLTRHLFPSTVKIFLISSLLQNFIETCFFDIQYFTFKGKNCLKTSISTLFSLSTCRITLRQEKVPVLWDLRYLAFGQFSRKSGIHQAFLFFWPALLLVLPHPLPLRHPLPSSRIFLATEGFSSKKMA